MSDDTSPDVSSVCKALASEGKTVKFYLEAARKVINGPARQMFRELAEEEATHVHAMNLQYESLSRGDGWVSLPEFCDCEHVDLTPIEVHMASLKGRIDRFASDLEALLTAAELESASFAFYSEQLTAATDPVAKALLANLLNAERHHFELVMSNWEYLNRTQHIT